MEISATKLQQNRLKKLVRIKKIFPEKKRNRIFQSRHMKWEDYLIQSLRTAGFGSSEFLKFSTMIDTDKLFVSYLKRLIKLKGV